MNIQGGALEGSGTITGSVNNSLGTLSPGLSPGQLNETGAYTQGPGGAFAVEIGGLMVGTEYDRAAITGSAALNGILNITLINGFEPPICVRPVSTDDREGGTGWWTEEHRGQRGRIAAPRIRLVEWLTSAVRFRTAKPRPKMGSKEFVCLLRTITM